MFGGIHGDRVPRRTVRRRIFPCILEFNTSILGEDEAKERTISCHGKFEGAI